MTSIIVTLLYVFSSTHNLYLYLWIGVLILNVVISLIFVPFILPLFYKRTPLEEGELKDLLELKMKEVDFPLNSISVIDASSRAKEANAMFSGLFGKRDLILFDTVIDTCSDEELADITLHEVGHNKHHHIYKLLLLQGIQLFFVLKLIDLFIFDDNLYTSFNFTTKPVVIGFVLLERLFEPLEEAIALLFNIFSRRFEYQADEYATLHGFGKLPDALRKLVKNNLSLLVEDPLVSTIENSHPTVVERIRAIRKIQHLKD